MTPWIPRAGVSIDPQFLVILPEKRNKKDLLLYRWLQFLLWFFKNRKQPNPPADKWLDLEKLTKELLLTIKTNRPFELVEVKFFTSAVFPNKDKRRGKLNKNQEGKLNRQFHYWDTLKMLGVKVIQGTHKIESGKRIEKQTDVNIATSITYDCCKKDVDCVVLLSNDSDFKAPLKIASGS